MYWAAVCFSSLATRQFFSIGLEHLICELSLKDITANANYRFALREIRLILATVIRRFELDLIPGQSHELRVHAVPYFKEGKYLMGLKTRND